jgi:hypothetical protein
VKLTDIPFKTWLVQKFIPERGYKSNVSVIRSEFIAEQYKSMEKENQCTCMCGEVLHYSKLFRCFYCGVYLCEKCCERHFEETRKEYFDRVNSK